MNTTQRSFIPLWVAQGQALLAEGRSMQEVANLLGVGRGKARYWLDSEYRIKQIARVSSLSQRGATKPKPEPKWRKRAERLLASGVSVPVVQITLSREGYTDITEGQIYYWAVRKKQREEEHAKY